MKINMQITLVQHEVEDAIKSYLAQRITIPEGTEFQIDLAQTRGSEGMKAIIDLVPATTGPKIVAGATRKPRSTPASTPTPTAEKPSVKEPEPEVVQEPETVSEPTEPQEEVTEATGTDDATAATEVEAEPEAEATPPAAPPVKSLFANLRKPQNG